MNATIETARPTSSDMPLITAVKPTPEQRTVWDAEFREFQAKLFASTQGTKVDQLFKTDATDLFDVFLSAFADPIKRQYLNCSCCRGFLKHFGSLAYIEAGALKSFVFGFDVNGMLLEWADAVQRMAATVQAARIKGFFFSRETVLGAPTRGGHDHMYAHNPRVHTDRIRTPGQAAALMNVQFGSLVRGMQEIKQDTFDLAVALLTNATLSQTKFLEQARRFADIRRQVDGVNQRTRDVVLWDVLASGGPGAGSVRSSALGSFLKDLQAGMDHGRALAIFKQMVDPMRYQVATTAPKAGNVQRAEQIVATLGLAPSFARRLALLGEVSARITWRPRDGATPGADRVAPTAKVAKAPGVFAGLADNAPAAQVQASVAQTLTWEQFVRRVLPNAQCIEVVPDGANTYGGITTAADASAPPLFAWDKDDARMPFSWYRWNATEPTDFGLTAPTQVLGVVPVPSAWNGGDPHPGVVLVLEGAGDARLDAAGLGLFPDLLRSDLHEVRSTIFAHSMRGVMDRPDGQLASGLVLRKGFTRATLRVTVGNIAVTYAIKGWD